MKGLSNVLAIIGVLLIIYCLMGKLMHQPFICLGIVNIKAVSGLVAANSLMLMAILVRLSSK